MSHEINQLGTKYALFCGPVALLNCELTRYFTFSGHVRRHCTTKWTHLGNYRKLLNLKPSIDVCFTIQQFEQLDDY